MPRPCSGSPLINAAVRRVAGRLCFAAAASATGVWGPTRLERALGFTPQLRRIDRYEAEPAPRPMPTNCCKRWLKGHVPCDQTLELIARSLPHVSADMRYWRDGPLVHALAGRCALTELLRLTSSLRCIGLTDAWTSWTVGGDDAQAERDFVCALTGLAHQQPGVDTFAVALWSMRQRGPFRPASVSQLNLLSLELLDATVQHYRQIEFVEDDLRPFCGRGFDPQSSPKATRLSFSTHHHASVDSGPDEPLS